MATLAVRHGIKQQDGRYLCEHNVEGEWRHGKDDQQNMYS